MRIAIMTIGTRGDVQPYLGVGRALEARGHRVVLATHREFEPLVRRHGLEFRPIAGGMREIAETPLGQAWLASGDSPFEYAKHMQRIFIPLQDAWCEDAYRAAEGCDAVAFYAIVAAALFAAERRGLPAVSLSPWPVPPTAELPPPAAPWAPRLLRKWITEGVYRLSFGAFQETLGAYRLRVGLPPINRPPLHPVFDLPIVHLFSEHVVARPRDWAERHTVAGYAFAPPGAERPREDVEAGVERFFGSGSVPIYVGFGSMTTHASESLAQVVADAAKMAGVRVVYARGWAGGAPEPAEHVHVVDEVPHDWLFPRVAAVVHHGGAGTFAAGLRAGKPTVIVPFFGDQPFWAGVNERLGTGVTVKRKGIRKETLAAALRAVVGEPRHARAATEIASRLAVEDGAARAAETIERLVSTAGPPFTAACAP